MKKLVLPLFRPGNHGAAASIGLLVLRLAFAAMMLAGHGWGKLVGFTKSADGFADPLGVGPTVSMALAIFAEVLCSAAVALGFATRAAAIPLVTTMVVAAFLVHADDPWARKELALLYGSGFLTLVFTGAGRFSIDQRIGK